MYPAFELANGEYTSSDLPDFIFIDDAVSIQQANRTGTNFIIEDGFAEGEDVVLGLNGETWGLWVDAGSGPEFILGDYDAPCLITSYGDYNEGVPFITDNFSDVYSISGPVSGTVVRESICVWSGENLTLSNYGFQWKVNGNNKSGAQNTPVGSYAGGFAVT